MATGVKPRNEENMLTRSDLEVIQDAMKSQKFRDMLTEYVEEVRDPANQALYQKEMTQLEKERGYDITFINPKGGYVIKTSVAGDRKAFINICSNENIGKPSYKVQVVDGKRGMNWQIPYTIIPPREDYDNKKERCVIYDVVFHADTLRMAEVNKQFRELVNKTAFDGLQKTYNIHFDSNNCRFPKAQYKGMNTPAVIRTEDPNYKLPTDEDLEDMTPEMMEKLYPQRMYPENQPQKPDPSKPDLAESSKLQQQKRKAGNDRTEFIHSSDEGYTIPKYVIKQQKNLDLQDFTYNRGSKQYTAIPSHIVVQINLPLLSSTKDCTLDVQEKSLSLVSEKPAKYKLSITLPYPVNDESGNAKFDKSKRMLIVTLPVIRHNSPSERNSLKFDSGVESAENSGSQSEDENIKDNLIVELSSTPAGEPIVHCAPKTDFNTNVESFLDTTLSYSLPQYTHNVLDDIIAFTFHIKNTDPDSVKVKSDANNVYIKFTTIGAGFVPVHYLAHIVFDVSVHFENVSGEAWDNNVILQLEFIGKLPEKCEIGLSRDSMTSLYFDISQIKKSDKIELEHKPLAENPETIEEAPSPLVAVTNTGNETNILVSSNDTEYDEDDEIESPTSKDEVIWTSAGTCENGAKSILRKPMSLGRSFSESSAGDIASSMDYISSDCIPEESSFKKTVRFSDVIARQFYRYNSSIEGQKKKNQRKKSKKRNLEQRKSESECEDEYTSISKQDSKPRLKSVLKPRRDSGLADTSDAELDGKNTPDDIMTSYDSARKQKDDSAQLNDTTGSGNIKSMLDFVDKNDHVITAEKSEDALWKSDEQSSGYNNEKKEPVTCDNIKHNMDFYDPDKLNKGRYLEIKFKNDLIFDLDM